MSEKARNSQSPLPPEIARLGFEEALSELEKLVRQLEDGKAKLDDAISAYERGALLKRHCEAKLREAQMKIERISVGEDGKVSAKPFES
jgi:exodeoxyribonuclease VII small subunit